MTVAPAGLVNFRDTGGIPLVGGGRTRSGVLFRSAAPTGLTEDAWHALEGLGVGTLVDLRSPTERDQSPTSAPAEVEVIELPLLEGAMNPELFRRVGSDVRVPTLAELYGDMVDDGGDTFAQVARIVARADQAVLVHCTAGKDRTGVAVALILDAVGAERERVVADYAATAAQLAGPWTERMLASMARMGLPASEELTAVATTSPAPVMEGLLARLAGGAAYLAANGLTDPELSQLRERLTCG